MKEAEAGTESLSDRKAQKKGRSTKRPKGAGVQKRVVASKVKREILAKLRRDRAL